MVYRDAFKQCLCAGSFRTVRWAGFSYEQCRECLGIWMREDVLAEMWQAMAKPSSSVPALTFKARTDGHGPRPCLECRRPMARVEALVVPVDRCADHGIWFDREELATILAGAALAPDDWLATFLETLRDMR